MKVDSKTLKNFLQKVSINNNVKEAVLKFNEEGVSVMTFDESNTIFVKAFLNKSAFTDYKVSEDLAISDLTKLKKFMERFEGQIDFVKDENVLQLGNRNRSFQFMLSDLETIKNPVKMPTLTYKNTFDLESKFLHEVLKNADVIEKGLSVQLKISDNKLRGLCGNNDNAEEMTDIFDLEEDVDVTFGEPLKQVMDVIEGKIKVSLSSNYPITLEWKDETMDLTFVVAQRNTD